MAELGVEEVLSRARARGLQAEVISVDTMVYELSWQKAESHGMTYYEVGYGIRVVNSEGRLGFAYGSSLTDNLLEMAARSAVASRPDKYNLLPSASPGGGADLSYDPSLEQPADFIKGLVDSALSYGSGRLNLISVRGWGGTSRVRVASTEGVDAEQENSFTGVATAGNYISGGYVGPEIYELMDSRTSKGVSADIVMRALLEKVELTSSREERRVTGRPIVLTPKAVNELLFPLLNHAVSLENVTRGKSSLRPGDDLGSVLSVFDNPRVPDASWSRAFDGEGLPTRQVEVIRNGSFITPLSNTYWSRRAGTENTHSSWRTYMTLPAISATYLVFDGPSVKDLGDAVFIDQVQGVHTSNFDTGEFSVSVLAGWDKGGGLREFVLSGDLRSLLKEIVGLTAERQRYGRVVTGSLMVEGLRTSS
ncbi:MAG: TldD/PmbA family protein [Acidilobus sp.]